MTVTAFGDGAAAALLADFAARGIRPKVYRTREGTDIVWRPWNRLTEADRAALRELWEGEHGVKALVLADVEHASSPSPSPVPAETGPQALARNDEPGPPRGSGQAPVPAVPTAARPVEPPPPFPTGDVTCVEVRRGHAVPIPFDGNKMDSLLLALARSRERSTWEP